MADAIKNKVHTEIDKMEYIFETKPNGIRRPYKLSNIAQTAGMEYLRPGQILGVRRYIGHIIHYGVYIGMREVIHFSSPSDIKNNTIIQTTMDDFLKGEEYFFVANVEKSLKFGNLYTPEEAVWRAKSELGKKDYHLLLNNCEHFAFWCRTGRSFSDQDGQFINLKGIKTKSDYLLNDMDIPKTLIKVSGFSSEKRRNK
ncbi:lecithin retinol acyltransferase family protein [Pontibacillus halophilus]|nr:lecithin retinol acyltransferase family protein [Pontibacillus halophilus]